MSARLKNNKKCSFSTRKTFKTITAVDQTLKNSQNDIKRSRSYEDGQSLNKNAHDPHDSSTNKNKIILSPIAANERIKKLIQNLYPTLQQMEDEENLHGSKNSQTSSKANLAWKADDYTSKQRLENRVLMSHAQRQLDQRLKNRVLQKYKRLSVNLSEPYSQVFQRFKTQQAQILKKKKQKQLQCFMYTRYKSPEVTAEGINLYPEIKNKIRLLDFTKQRIMRKKLEKQQNRLSNQQKQSDIISNTILKPLITRKRKQTLNQSKMKGRWKTQKQQEETETLKQIKSRLRRIYTRTGLHEPSEKTKSQLKDSNLMKHQHNILQKLQNSPNKVSIKGKIDLTVKFNDILNQFARSLTVQKAHNNHKKDSITKQNSRVCRSSLDNNFTLKYKKQKYSSPQQNVLNNM